MTDIEIEAAAEKLCDTDAGKIGFTKGVLWLQSQPTVEGVIHHETITIYDWKERIRILFGRKSRTVSQIFTKQQVTVTGSSAQVFVDFLIKRKDKVMGMISQAMNNKKA